MDITTSKIASLIVLLTLLVDSIDTGIKEFQETDSEGRNKNTQDVNETNTTSIDNKRNVRVFEGFFAIMDNDSNLANDSSYNDFNFADEKLRNDVDVTSEKLRHRRLMKGRKLCVHLSNLDNKWIEMIVTCPRYYLNKIIQGLCHRSIKPGTTNHQTQYTDSENTTTLNIQHFPVQDDEGTVYGNVFCAVCNQVISLHMMDVFVRCNQTINLRIVDGGKEFSIFQSMPIGKCEQILIPSNPSRIRTCRPNNFGNPLSRMMTLGESSLGQSSLKYPVSFTLLMNFGFDGKTHVLFSNTHFQIERYVEKKCTSAKQVFVAQFNSCRKVHCYEGYTLTRFGCVARSDKKKLGLLHGDHLKGILDSQTIGNLDKIALVSLEMNITYGDLRSLVSPDLETNMIDGISQLLNINRERIQNLTIAILNVSVPGNHFHINTLPKTKFEITPSLHKDIQIPNHIHVKNPASNNVKNNLPFGKQHQYSSNKSKSHFKDTNESSPISATKAKHVSLEKLHLHIPSKSKGRFKYHLKSKIIFPVALDNNAKFTNRKASSKPKPRSVGKVDLIARKLKTNYVKSSEPDTRNDVLKNPATIRVSFLLLPSRNNGSTAEESVSSLVQKIKEVIADERFTLIINETVIKVVNNKKETDRWLGTNFCYTGVPVTLFRLVNLDFFSPEF